MGIKAKVKVARISHPNEILIGGTEEFDTVEDYNKFVEEMSQFPADGQPGSLTLELDNEEGHMLINPRDVSTIYVVRTDA